MLIPSPLLAAFFCGLVAVVAAISAWAFSRVRGGGIAAGVASIAYLAIPGILAAVGALDRYDPLPAPAVVLLGGLTILTVSLVVSPFGGRLAATYSFGALIALQAFRIPVELVLHSLYLDGFVPVQMTYEGRNFDIVTGVSGLALGGWALSGRRVPTAWIWAWNIVGIGLLANIVAIAVLSTPVSFRQFHEGPANLVPSTFPYVWLPSFLVQIALGSHLLIFRKLLRPGAAPLPENG